MKMKNLVAALALLGPLVAGAARAEDAQVQALPVQVRLSPAVQARAHDLGADEIERERAQLERDVARALAHNPAAPTRVKLTIDDLQPNRPTSKQLGLSPSLSPFTSGLGGAAVTGQVIGAGGAIQPVRYRFFPPNLESETSFDTWGDADQAFDTVARQIGDGHPPDDERPWPPPHMPRAPTGTRLPG